MDAAHLLARARMRLYGDSTSIGRHDGPADSCPVVSMGESQEASVPERVLLSSGRYIHFGPFRVDQQKQEVSRDGARIKLQGKVYQTLLALLEKPGEVVTRKELRMRLWPDDTHVNYDANVNTQAILGMGRENRDEVVRLLLFDLQQNRRPWFWALSYLTGDNPIGPEDTGRMDKMVGAWVKWGKRKGLL